MGHDPQVVYAFMVQYQLILYELGAYTTANQLRPVFFFGGEFGKFDSMKMCEFRVSTDPQHVGHLVKRFSFPPKGKDQTYDAYNWLRIKHTG